MAGRRAFRVSRILAASWLEEVGRVGERFLGAGSSGISGIGFETFGAMPGLGVLGTLSRARAEAPHSWVNQTAAVERGEERRAVHRTRAGACKSQGPLTFGPCTGGKEEEGKPRKSWANDNTEGGPPRTQGPAGLPRS